MAELFIGPIIEKLIDISSEYLKDQFRWQTGMKEEIKRLQENYTKTQAVVSHANQEGIIDKDPALNKWIWQLRDAIDEADDLLDDFEYMRHKNQLATNMSSFKSLLFATSRQFRKVGKRALKIDPILKRLEEVVQKLNRVSAEVSTFLHLIDRAQLEQQVQLVELNKHREEGSLPTCDLLGRGDDKEFIMQWLSEPSNEEHQTHVSGTNLYKNISLLSIVGDGGLGKTTLLQHIYNVYKDEMRNEFELKMWVCVSNNFDVKKVIAGMLESLKKAKIDLETIDAFQCILKSEVISKKFLLVLDDIWEEDDEGDKRKWEKVLAPLAHGSLGSKILITTRMDSVASKIAKVINKKKKVRRLEGLEEDECLKILTTHAFAGVENLDDHKKLRSIAIELVKKLFGSPLAAKVLGGVLNSDLNEKHWTKVLNSNLGQNDIFPILKLSYIFLPKHLQNCFSFCSIFSQDHEFDKEELVRMWIAVGFVRPSNIQEETLEDIGERYFDVLVNKSFFDKVITTYYKMHDLLHDLAQFVSKQECFRDVGDEKSLLSAPETIRHLSIKLSNLKVLGKMGRFKNLRTLRITYNENHQDYVDTFNKIFKVTRSIRLLDIQSNWWYSTRDVIPNAIQNLKHLRFFRFDSNITQLPRFLSKLYHLQFIIFHDFSYNCDSRYFFPRDMNNLSNIRYVSYPRLTFSGIGKLVFLQQLEQFYVDNEIGYRIEELKHMNDLCVLGINQLENMRDATEACNAKLCNKGKLRKLSLNWSYGIYRPQNIVNCDLDERVFDKLQPHKYLKELHINNYMGVRFAVWMNDAHLTDNLELIELRDCLECKILPPFGHLPFLKMLRLENMPKVKRLDNKFPGNDKYCDFPSLEKLHISKLEALEDLFDAGVDSWFPCLTKLEIYNCPNLQELPYLPPKIETLRVDNIGWKTWNWCNISTVSLANLKEIDLRNCLEWQIFPPFGQLPFLRYLRLENMPKVKRLDNDKYCIFPSLKELHISELEALEDWFDARVDYLFPCLTELELFNCPNLKEFPYLPPKLVTLRIENIGGKTLKCIKTLKCTITTQRKVEIIDCPNSITLEEQKQLETIPNRQFILKDIKINNPSVLQMELFRNVVSISELNVEHNEELISFSTEAERWFLQGSSSVDTMNFWSLTSLQSLPSFTTFSSLRKLDVSFLPRLQELPDLPASVTCLILFDLRSLRLLPSSLSALSSLEHLELKSIPLLKSLPYLPASLKFLKLYSLKSLQLLPSSLSAISSLQILQIEWFQHLKSLPELPPSLCTLHIESLDNLECLPACLSSLSSLKRLSIKRVPLLREIPTLPPSLEDLVIGGCHPKLQKHCDQFTHQKHKQ